MPSPRALALLIAALASLVAATAAAQSQPWPFELDPAIAADPAAVQSRLDELGAGVPPIPAGELVGTALGQVTLYFHADMLELLQRAYASGPGLQRYFVRVPATCAAHATFSLPSALLADSSASCQSRAEQIRAAFDDDGQSCLRIEFPELYVYDQTPGEADHDALQTLEGLISVAGEVLTHIDYPSDLLPAGFEQEARTILAKIRHDTLLADARARRQAYQAARASLQDGTSCFDAGVAAGLLASIDTLVAELDAAESHLEALHAAGLAQAALDRQALQARGRTRPTLPYPALTDRERELLALYLGGLYWRMRGSALLDYPESGLLRRLIYVQYPYQVLADLTGGVDGETIGRDIFIHENWGYYEWMDIGHEPGNDKYSDLVDMAKRGKRTLDLAEPRLRERGYDTAHLYAGGLQMGPCYYYGWDRLWDHGRLFQLGEDLPDPYMWFLECPTAHGEFCTGGALGVGLARTLLNGKSASACEPQCAGLSCGGDGCGGSCGSCAPGSRCQVGVCVADSLDAGVVDSGNPDLGGGSAHGQDAASALHDAGDATWPDAGLATPRDASSTATDAGRGGAPGHEAPRADEPEKLGCSGVVSPYRSPLALLLLLTGALRRARSSHSCRSPR